MSVVRVRLPEVWPRLASRVLLVAARPVATAARLLVGTPKSLLLDQLVMVSGTAYPH
jgi:hypothetical protein